MVSDLLSDRTALPYINLFSSLPFPPLIVSSPLMPIFSFYTFFAGDITALRAAKQIGVKMETAVFGKGGLGGDANAAEKMIKEYIPEDMRMCDVTYPRYRLAVLLNIFA